MLVESRLSCDVVKVCFSFAGEMRSHIFCRVWQKTRVETLDPHTPSEFRGLDDRILQSLQP